MRALRRLFGERTPAARSREDRHVPALDDLLRRFDGRPIPRCPGRYVLRGVEETVPPGALLQGEGSVTEHVTAKARDRVVVSRVRHDETWGLISYARSDGTWVHTANTPEGFARKLTELGISTDLST